MSIDRRWYKLGRYQILAKPLDTNPYWTTHHIYLRGECIGRQLSVPCETDCDWYAAGARYAHESYVPQPPSKFNCGRRPGHGRPRKSRAKVAAITEHPIEGELKRALEALA